MTCPRPWARSNNPRLCVRSSPCPWCRSSPPSPPRTSGRTASSWSACSTASRLWKDKMPKIWNKYSQNRNIGASVPISTLMCLWANYIFPRWVCLFCWRKYVDRSWEHINRSQTHECGIWGWGRAIPRKGIYKRSCRCSAQVRLLVNFSCARLNWDKPAV